MSTCAGLSNFKQTLFSRSPQTPVLAPLLFTTTTIRPPESRLSRLPPSSEALRFASPFLCALTLFWLPVTGWAYEGLIIFITNCNAPTSALTEYWPARPHQVSNNLSHFNPQPSALSP